MSVPPRRSAGRVTIKDVAAEAGVSIATVSRVLSNSSRPVDPVIAQRVRDVSERLGYRVNVAARALRTDRTGTVGMVVPHISNPYFPQMVEAVERQLYHSGHELVLCDSLGDTQIEYHRIQALVSGRVDALIFVPADEKQSWEAVRFARERVPVVLLDRRVEHESASFVGVDNHAGMQLLVDHVRAAGATQMTLIAANDMSSATRQRTDAFLALTARKERSVVAGGEYSLEWGREAVRRIWKRTSRPDAVLCAADVMAVGAVAELRTLGVRVPEDVVVTGFDDIAVASATVPTLTTVRQPYELMAEAAVRCVILDSPGAASAVRDLVLPPTLVARESSART